MKITKRDIKRLNESLRKWIRVTEGKKPLGESLDTEPKIYVGTYAKYNSGNNPIGKDYWVTVTDYSDYGDFVEACKELHSDEKDPEFMIQDFEGFPRAWYSESGLPDEETFNNILEYAELDDDEREAFAVFLERGDGQSFDDFREAYVGEFKSAEDFAYDMVENIGWEGVGDENLETYFDYDSFGRDLMYDFHRGDGDETDAEGEPEDPDHYYDEDGYDQGEYESDEQVGYDFVEGIGGIKELGDETVRRYFDYESFGRDLLINDYWEDGGYVFRYI